MHRSTGEVPSFAPAASPHLRRRPSVWPPHRHSEPASESTTHRWWSCTADRPTSTRLEPAARLRSFTHWFKLRLHLPVTLAGPGSSGGADPSRRCRGCSHPHLRPQAQAAPSFKGLLRQANGGVLSPPPGTRRLVAHRTARHNAAGRQPTTRTVPVFHLLCEDPRSPVRRFVGSKAGLGADSTHIRPRCGCLDAEVSPPALTFEDRPDLIGALIISTGICRPALSPYACERRP